MMCMRKILTIKNRCQPRKMVEIDLGADFLHGVKPPKLPCTQKISNFIWLFSRFFVTLHTERDVYPDWMLGLIPLRHVGINR